MTAPKSPLSFVALALAGFARPCAHPARRSRPREPDSGYGQIRAVLAAAPFTAFRARDVRRRLLRRGVRLTHEAVSQRLHKMHHRRQVQRVEVPGEWFARWQIAE